MKKCLDCGVELRGHGNPQHCRKCARLHDNAKRIESMRNSPAVRKNVCKAVRIRWANPNAKRCGKPSPHENVLAAMLTKAGLDYIHQFNPEGCRWVYDFLLPDLGLLLELDGMDHYYYAKVKARDYEKDAWALEHGYDIGRIWVSDLSTITPDQLARELNP